MSKTHQERANEGLVFDTIIGSHAYGTAVEGSDQDRGGICLLRAPEHYLISPFFHQVDRWGGPGGKWVDERRLATDRTVYEIRKALDLCLNGNPNMLDYLFGPEHCVLRLDPEWAAFRNRRDLFVSQKCRHTFHGYAYAQTHKMLNHRKFLQEPPKEPPTRKAFGLPEQSVFPRTQIEAILRIAEDYVDDDQKSAFHNAVVRVWDDELYGVFLTYLRDRRLVHRALNDWKVSQDAFMGMLASLGSQFLKEGLHEQAAAELSLDLATKQWKEYQTWKAGRNPRRAADEAKFGYDTKFAMHAIRLSRMAVEILGGQGIRVDRRDIDADYLLSVREGRVAFEDVMSELEGLKARIESLTPAPDLPREPRRQEVNALLLDVLQTAVFPSKS